MADALASVSLDRAVCSGLPRTQQTAELILRGRDLSVEEIKAFQEIRAGRLRDIAPERWDAEFVYGFETAHRDGATFAGGERFVAFEERVIPAFEQICTEPGWTQLLLVAHDGVNRLLLGWAVGTPRSSMGAFEQDMCCLNIIDIDLVDGQIVRRMIKALNVTPYNLPKLGLHLTSMEQVSSAFGRIPGSSVAGGGHGGPE